MMPAAIVITGSAVARMPTARPAMMFVACPVCDASAIDFTGFQRVPGVVLGDRDEREGDAEADQRRAVQLPEAELAAVERHRDGDEADRGEDRRDDDRLVERVDDRVRAAGPTRAKNVPITEARIEMPPSASG